MSLTGHDERHDGGRMSETNAFILPPAQKIAVAYATVHRPALEAFFALDIHCAGLVRRSSEPLLAQMKLAWWRDNLSLPYAQRPRGEPLLDRFASWEGHADLLVESIAAWEHLLGGEPLDSDAALAFARTRAQGFAGFALLAGCALETEDALSAGARWALADLAAHVSSAQERESVVRAGEDLVGPTRLSRALRPFAVLESLASRSLKRGGAPLLSDRASALVALRVGLLGR